jgi:GNAT superfamily N-acetyltransferase
MQTRPNGAMPAAGLMEPAMILGNRQMPFVRQASPDDRLELRSMQMLSARVLGAGYYTGAQIEAFLAHVGTMDDFLLHEGTYYVAVEDGIIVASGGWSRRQPNYANVTGPAGYRDTATPKIRSVFVHPAWARRGLARHLVELAETEMRMAGHAEAELTATIAGVPLYETLGYKVTQHLTVMLPDSIELPLVHMAKELSAPAGNGVKAAATVLD